MTGWRSICAMVALGAAVAMPLGEASAQQAPAARAQAEQAAPAKPVVLRARDLMTPQERQAFRQALRAARADPARRTELRTQMRETLRQRAIAKGGVLMEPGMAKPGMKAREGAAPEKRPAPPRAP